MDNISKSRMLDELLVGVNDKVKGNEVLDAVINYSIENSVPLKLTLPIARYCLNKVIIANSDDFAKHLCDFLKDKSTNGLSDGKDGSIDEEAEYMEALALKFISLYPTVVGD